MNTKINSNNRLDTVKVKMLQLQKGVLNLDISRRYGFSPAEVSRHVVGDGRRKEVQLAIAEALGVSLDEIVFKVDMPSASAERSDDKKAGRVRRSTARLRRPPMAGEIRSR